MRGDIRKSRCTTGVVHRWQIMPPVPLVFPQAPDYNIRIISNFLEHSRRYSQVKVHHRCQRHRWQIAAGINDAGGKLPPVSTTPLANLPPVSLTPVANNGNNIRLQTPESELKVKNLYICFLYYPKVTKQNY
jgi:hypothetical protein